MGAELVILAEREATMDEWARCAHEVVGEGIVRGYQGGVTHLLDAEGNGLVAYWEGRHLENRREAYAMAGEAVMRHPLWIDVVLRFGNEHKGRAIAQLVADRIGGELVRLGENTGV